MGNDFIVDSLVNVLSNRVATAFHTGSEIAVVAAACLVVLAVLLLCPLFLGPALPLDLIRPLRATKNSSGSCALFRPGRPAKDATDYCAAYRATSYTAPR